MRRSSGGFTLPSVLIASVIMMAVLAMALQVAAVTARSLEDQYYQQLAREAAEAGAAVMGQCIIQDITSAAVVKPETDCHGVVQPGKSQYIANSGNVRSYFIGRYTGSTTSGAVNRRAQAEGVVELQRSSDSKVYRSYAYTSRQQVVQEIDQRGSRAAHRWWLFGINAKLDFGVSGNNLPTVSSIGGAGGPVERHEGTTTVSDRDGNLLFMSDGISVWNRHGDYMAVASNATNDTPNCNHPPAKPYPFPSGSSQNLCGSYTATQAVAAFPIDKAEKRYAVISNTATPAHNIGHSYGRLFWSEIDFRKNSLGKITKRNNPVWPGATSHYSSEALNARPNAAGSGVIVYTYKPHPATVYAFPITYSDNGDTVTTSAPTAFSVPADLQPVHCADTNPKTHTGFGTVNFNSDYTKMIVLMSGSGCTGNSNAGSLLLFDISQGDTSMQLIASWNIGARHVRDNGYGYAADFSPSGRYLYVSKIYPGELFRYDLSSGDSTQIKASEAFVGWTGCQYFLATGTYQSPCSVHPSYEPSYRSGSDGKKVVISISDWLDRPADGGGQVLRGPDGRMYVANRGAPRLSYVGNPDAPNIADVQWTYGGVRISDGQPQGIALSETRDPSTGAIDHLAVNERISMYGLPQMVTRHTPRLIQY